MSEKVKEAFDLLTKATGIYDTMNENEKAEFDKLLEELSNRE